MQPIFPDGCPPTAVGYPPTAVGYPPCFVTKKKNLGHEKMPWYKHNRLAPLWPCTQRTEADSASFPKPQSLPAQPCRQYKAGAAQFPRTKPCIWSWPSLFRVCRPPSTSEASTPAPSDPMAAPRAGAATVQPSSGALQPPSDTLQPPSGTPRPPVGSSRRQLH